MTYLTAAIIQRNPAMRDRVSACVVIEGIALYPEQWAAEHAWELAAQPGWADAWESALAGDHEEDYDPGEDSAVITDGMILSAVQAINTTEEARNGNTQ